MDFAICVGPEKSKDIVSNVRPELVRKCERGVSVLMLSLTYSKTLDLRRKFCCVADVF
jgi:hypothetical protein